MKIKNNILNIPITQYSVKIINNESTIKTPKQMVVDVLGAKYDMKSISVERIYVFQTGFTGNLGILCFRKQGDAPNVYRGGMRFPMEEIDTEEKAFDKFILYKDKLSIMDGSYIGNNKPLVLEFMNVEVLT